MTELRTSADTADHADTPTPATVAQQHDVPAIVDGEPAFTLPAAEHEHRVDRGQPTVDIDGEPPFTAAGRATDAPHSSANPPDVVDGEPLFRPADATRSVMGDQLPPANGGTDTIGQQADVDDGPARQRDDGDAPLAWQRPEIRDAPLTGSQPPDEGDQGLRSRAADTAGGATDPGRSDAATDQLDEAGEPVPATPRYDLSDLTPTGRRDMTYGRELMRGPDGYDHFPGDEVGTRRYADGASAAAGRWVADTNPPPRPGIDFPAEQHFDTERQHKPADTNPHPADTEVADKKQDRADLIDRRDSTWTERIQPIADRLAADHGIAIDKHATGEKALDVVKQARAHMTPAERITLTAAMRDLVDTNREIKHASERLGVAGGTLAVAREFPNARLVTGGDYARGTPGNLDRIVMIDEASGSIIVVEEKGAGGTLTDRWVDNPVTGQPKLRAQQGSTEYLRHMLQHDNKLADALDTNPALRQRMSAILAQTGRQAVRYLYCRTSKEGIVTVTDFKIDERRLDRSSITLPTRNRAQETP